MQALILAAGMGSRLKGLTETNTKCMVEVNGVTMIERMLRQLDTKELTQIIVVVGYRAKDLMAYINTLNIQTPIKFVENEIYDKTNNIYSLYVAIPLMKLEDTLLLESDLIMEDGVLDRIIETSHPNSAVVSKYEAWMDGTVVTINQDELITSFIPKENFDYSKLDEYYKTVNIYKLSKDYINTVYVPFLESYMETFGTGGYYEKVFEVATFLKQPLYATVLDQEVWYEVDDKQDLDIAETIFSTNPQDKLNRMMRRFGGYWRFPKLVDFCYLVNPFYPTPRLVEEVKASTDRLIRDYPSGMGVNTALAAKYFDIEEDKIVIGNGASELIKSVMEQLHGNIGVILPTFEEYPNRSNHLNVITYDTKDKNYRYNAQELIEYFSDKDLNAFVLINPDNPSANYIPKAEVIELAKYTHDHNITLILDESFIDFVDYEEDTSLLTDTILETYPNLIIVKSISKSFGIPGFRLGILASGNKELIGWIKRDVSIWNINSFGEFYMQIAEKYAKDYKSGLKKFYDTRKEYIEKLSEIKGIEVIPSQSNYVMCRLLPPLSSNTLTLKLLDEYNLLIKDLTPKKGFDDGEYIRIAVKTPEENNTLVEALTRIISEC